MKAPRTILVLLVLSLAAAIAWAGGQKESTAGTAQPAAAAAMALSEADRAAVFKAAGAVEQPQPPRRPPRLRPEPPASRA